MFKATNSFFTFEEIFILGPEREIWQLEKTFWDCKQFVNARTQKYISKSKVIYLCVQELLPWPTR